jgi:hypothetical protein
MRIRECGLRIVFPIHFAIRSPHFQYTTMNLNPNRKAATTGGSLPGGKCGLRNGISELARIDPF